MGKAARVNESRSSEGGQSLVFKNLSTFSDLIVSNLPFLDNDEALGTRSETYQTYYLTARPGGYIAIAARTLGRCTTGALILPETLGEAGLVMM